MQTVRNLCESLAWGVSDLSREAGISYNTARLAYEGDEPSNRVKRAICSALSRALGSDIRPGDIQWKVKG